jgi:hypothetical protein
MSTLDVRPTWQLPVQWPVAKPDDIRGPVAAERLVKAAIVFAMLALTVLDRFGLRVSAEGSLPVGMMAMYALAAAMLLGGVAQLNPRAALAYLAVVTVATVSLLLNAAYAPVPFLSKMSLLFLMVLYAPLCLSLRQGAVPHELWRWTLSLYISFAVLVGVAGITQYFIQFIFRPPWLFDYTPLIPEAIRVTQAYGGWNTDYTVLSTTASAWTKSNGFFMREPSFFSVVMALGLICEMSVGRRKWVMAVLIMGLLLSYSGSGLLCLALALLFPLGRGTVARAVAFMALAAGLFLLFGDALHLSYTLDRRDEFLVKNSSAYCRFIGPTLEVVRHVGTNPWTILLGNGPGSMPRMGTSCAFWSQTTYAKLLFEFGLLGTLAFGVLMLGALNRSSAPVRLRVAAALAWLFLAGNLLDGLYLLFIYVISAMWPEHAARTLPDTARSILPNGRLYGHSR